MKSLALAWSLFFWMTVASSEASQIMSKPYSPKEDNYTQQSCTIQKYNITDILESALREKASTITNPDIVATIIGLHKMEESSIFASLEKRNYYRISILYIMSNGRTAHISSEINTFPESFKIKTAVVGLSMAYGTTEEDVKCINE